jgi:hypothetical protein
MVSLSDMHCIRILLLVFLGVLCAYPVSAASKENGASQMAPPGMIVLETNGSATSNKSGAVNPGSSMKLDNPLGTNSLLELVRRIIQTFVGVLGAFTLLVMIYAGFTWMTAGGDTSRVQKAQQTIRYAVIGLGMIIFSYAIVSFAFRAITGS